MILMVALSSFGVMTLLQSAFLAAGAMLIFRCCSPSQAMNSINWNLLASLAGSITLDFVEDACQAVGLDDIGSMQVKVAVEEAVVNVMKYAYPSEHRGNVTIRVASDSHSMEFTIIDSGKPFDPTVQSQVDTTLSAKQRKIGGLGIHIMRQNMDAINYERKDQFNVLTLRKNIKSVNSKSVNL